MCAAAALALGDCGDAEPTGADTTSAGAAPTPLKHETWTFVVLPDTQYYSAWWTDVYDAQTRFIADHQHDLRIAFVLHVGDVTDNDSHQQWTRARASMSRIDSVVPYVIVPGNHDLWDNSAARDTLMNDYFPVSTWMMQQTFGGAFEQGRSENTYHLIDTPDGVWLVLALEFGPRRAALNWAQDVLESHVGTPTVLLTHAFLYTDGERYDHLRRPEQQWNPYDYGIGARNDVSDGEEMYESLVEPYEDVGLVISGHAHNNGGAARRTDLRHDGVPVHQMLADYQAWDMGGGGYLRIVTVYPDRFDVRTYSPYLDAHLHDDANEFSLQR